MPRTNEATDADLKVKIVIVKQERTKTKSVSSKKDGKKYWVCSEYNKCKTAVMYEAAGA